MYFLLINKIFKRSIDVPEEFSWDISEYPDDYPPRLSLQYSPTALDATNELSNLIKLRVDGLDRELSFNINVRSKESKIVCINGT